MSSAHPVRFYLCANTFHIAQEYAYLKGIEVKPVMIAIRQLIDICGDKNIEDYDRADARNFIDKCEKINKYLKVIV
jgi:hypothetical protein